MRETAGHPDTATTVGRDTVPPPDRFHAIILDHGGVVAQPSSVVLATFPDRFGLTLAEFREAVGRASARLGTNLMADIEVGRITEATFRRQVESDLPPGGHLDGFGEAYYQHLQPDPSILALAAAVHAAGYRTALTSNSAREWTPLWQRVIPDLDGLFDVVLTSAEVGARKPDARFFDVLLSRLDVPAERCLLVDDKEENCDAAGRLGMRAVLFDETATTIARIREALGE